MSAITQYETLPNWITIREDNNTYPYLMNIERESCIVALSAFVTKAFMFKGQKPHQTDVVYIATNLYEQMLKDKYLRQMKLPEIQDCIDRAVTGRSVDLFGINVSSLMGALNQYCHDEIRERNLETYRRRIEREEKEQSLFLKRDETKALAQNLANNLKKV